MAKTNIIYGIHAVRAALERAPASISLLYVQQGLTERRLAELVALARQAGIDIKKMPKDGLADLTQHKVHQGVLAVVESVKEQPTDLEAWLETLSGAPFLLILDGVQDPHNLGACLRSADAAGVHAVIAPKDRAVGITPVVTKVACGAAEAVPFFQVTNLARTLRLLKERGIWLYGASGDGVQTLWETDLTGPLGLVMGAEGQGLRRLTQDLCDGLIKIPMLGSVSSLNVSVATGVCLFEAVRQMTHSKPMSTPPK